MRLILNGVNGRYLREITENAAPSTEYVEAAVAYVTEDSLLFEWCWEKNIPLRFWGRFDETIPIKPAILRTFLSRRSPNFVCKLLTNFHAKVIWWHGFGSYIGSANFSDRAWNGNIEAGLFFDDTEMIASSMDIELRAFFHTIDEHSAPLTDELFRLIEARAGELTRLAEHDSDRRRRFLNTASMHQWNGMLHTTRNTATDRQKQAFIEEWYGTLQQLRDIGERIARDENRPAWLPKTVPAGAQADQFLHAHYFHNVIGERRQSRFEEQFELNKSNPERALEQAIDWWHDLAEPPFEEQTMLLEWAPFLRSALASDSILQLSESDFEAVCQRVWSIQDHGRRVANVVLNLPEGQHYDMATKTKELGKYLFTRRSKNGSSVLEVLYHALYGGTDETLPSRLWDSTTDGPWRIDHLGISALGELVGWGLPDKFPPRNNRTSKSLRSLGFPVAVHG